MAPQRMYGRKDVADLLGLTLRQLQRWIESKKFPQSRKVGRSPRWMECDIIAWQNAFLRGEFEEPDEPEKRKAH